MSDKAGKQERIDIRGLCQEGLEQKAKMETEVTESLGELKKTQEYKRWPVLTFPTTQV